MNQKLIVYFLILLFIVLSFSSYVGKLIKAEMESEPLDLEVTLSTDKSVLNDHDEILISLKLTNIGNKNVTLTFTDGQKADFEIINEYNERVYYWSHDKMFTQMLWELTILGGETIEIFNATWNQSDNNYQLLPSGNYKILGWITSWPIFCSNIIGIQIVNNEPAIQSDLIITTSTNKKYYEPKEDVNMLVTVTNNGEESFNLSFPNYYIAGFELLNKNRQRLFVWSFNESFILVGTNLSIPAKETVELINATWNPNGLEGNFTIRSWLNTKPRVYSNFVSVKISYNITVSLTTDKKIYRRTEEIIVSIEVTNTGNEDKMLFFPSSQLLDFEVLNKSGERIYLWSFNHGFFYHGIEKLLPAGKTIKFPNETWSQIDFNGSLLPTGKYTIRGWPAMLVPKIISDPVTIQIESNQSKKVLNLNVTLSTDKSSYRVNETVLISISVINIGLENIELSFTHYEFVDFEILNENNKQIFSWSSNKDFIQSVKYLELSPGESKELLNDTWIANVSADNYTIITWLNLSTRLFSNIIKIQIIASDSIVNETNPIKKDLTNLNDNIIQTDINEKNNLSVNFIDVDEIKINNTKVDKLDKNDGHENYMEIDIDNNTTKSEHNNRFTSLYNLISLLLGIIIIMILIFMAIFLSFKWKKEIGCR